MKPALTRPCPICKGPMSWCADVPTEEEAEGHVCHQLTCTTCEYNVDFHDKQSMLLPEMDALVQHVAHKWNGTLETSERRNDDSTEGTTA